MKQCLRQSRREILKFSNSSSSDDVQKFTRYTFKHVQVNFTVLLSGAASVAP